MTRDRSKCSWTMTKVATFLIMVTIHHVSSASLGEIRTTEVSPATKTCDLSLNQCQEAYANNNTAEFKRDCYIFNDLVFGSETVKACATVCSTKTPGDERMCNHPNHCPNFELAGEYCDALTTITTTIQASITRTSTSHSSSSSPPVTLPLSTGSQPEKTENKKENENTQLPLEYIIVLVVGVLSVVIIAAIAIPLIWFCWHKGHCDEYSRVSTQMTTAADGTEESSV